MSSKIMRYVVPLDEIEFTLSLRGLVLFVAATDDVLELFVMEDDELTAYPHTFKIFENGESIYGFVYVASFKTDKARHLFRFVGVEESWKEEEWQPSTNGEPVESAEPQPLQQ